MLAAAGNPQEHTVFAGAAIGAGLAGMLDQGLFRTAITRELDASLLLLAAV